LNVVRITKAKNYNAAGTELNFILGLCLRHNILLMRRSNSILIVKNKIAGHNSAAVLYADNLRRSLFKAYGDK